MRRWAEEVVPGPDGDRMVISYSEPDAFARWVVGYGADVVVLGPDDVRKATIARLRDLVDALDSVATEGAAAEGATAPVGARTQP